MKSEVIFSNQHYTACAMGDGSLIVTANRRRESFGRRMVGDLAQIWIEAIRTTIDADEASILCRSILA